MVSFSTTSELPASIVMGAVNPTEAMRMSKASIRFLRTLTGSMKARLHEAPSHERCSPTK